MKNLFMLTSLMALCATNAYGMERDECRLEIENGTTIPITCSIKKNGIITKTEKVRTPESYIDFIINSGIKMPKLAKGDKITIELQSEEYPSDTKLTKSIDFSAIEDIDAAVDYFSSLKFIYATPYPKKKAVLRFEVHLLNITVSNEVNSMKLEDYPQLTERFAKYPCPSQEENVRVLFTGSVRPAPGFLQSNRGSVLSAQ
jgi:hypothetical protein